jgi:hypothetical protein
MNAAWDACPTTAYVVEAITDETDTVLFWGEATGWTEAADAHFSF